MDLKQQKAFSLILNDPNHSVWSTLSAAMASPGSSLSLVFMSELKAAVNELAARIPDSEVGPALDRAWG